MINKIKKQMALRNLSIRELSEKSGVGYNNLRLFLLGKVKNPKFITVNKIVSALGITWQDLLEDEDITLEFMKRKIIESDLKGLSNKKLDLVLNYIYILKEEYNESDI